LIAAPSPSALHLAPFTTAAIFVFLGGFFIPVPQEAVLLATGYYFGDQHLPVWIAAVAATLAVVVSDNLFYLAARFGSPLVLRLKRKLNPKIVERYAQAMRERPGKTIFLVRFIPGVRVLAPLLSGIGKVPLSLYELSNFAAAALYVPAYVALGSAFHGSIESLVDSVQEGQNTAFAVGLLAVTLFAAYELRRRFYSPKDTP
jgi:undecaprenyl-diphosphatase